MILNSIFPVFALIILGGVLAGLALVYPFWRQRVQAAARKEK